MKLGARLVVLVGGALRATLLAWQRAERPRVGCLVLRCVDEAQHTFELRLRWHVFHTGLWRPIPTWVKSIAVHIDGLYGVRWSARVQSCDGPATLGAPAGDVATDVVPPRSQGGSHV